VESFAKRHPALAILAVALVLWFALNWWRHRHPELLGAAGTGATAPQTPAEKLAATLDKTQDFLAKAAVIVPPLALLTPGTASRVYNNVKGFLGSFNGGGFDATVKFAGGTGTLPLSDFSGPIRDLPGIPANAQVDNKGEITFDGTTAANWVATWRSMGFQVYVDGDAITLKPDPTAADHLGAPPAAAPPAGAA